MLTLQSPDGLKPQHKTKPARSSNSRYYEEEARLRKSRTTYFANKKASEDFRSLVLVKTGIAEPGGLRIISPDVYVWAAMVKIFM
ncbi:MAG: hypothetical protein U9Q82_07015 [Chloroflexota bacterium]|nr:hypothetical protein [Chloroflexota bacterium]